MKEIIRKLSLLILVCFSFFYTDRVLNFINNHSLLMKAIKSKSSDYEVEEVNATVYEDEIVPGMKGRKVNIKKTFNNMKDYNTFREEDIIYEDIIPVISIINNRDKFITSGNNRKKEVAIILIISNNIDKYVDIKDAALFINHNLLTIDNINKLKDKEIYTYGNNGKYSKEILLNDNTLINTLTNSRSKYCLSSSKDYEVLNICKENDMYTVIPNLIGDYKEVKDNLKNGSIILLWNTDNIDIIKKYIYSKGYDIVSLDELLSE